MNAEEFDFILQTGEGYLIEFKEKIDKSFARELVAFANASGGRIFLGVNDKNESIGISISISYFIAYAKPVWKALGIIAEYTSPA